MLAGIQLDVFTPLKAGSMTAEQLAAAIGWVYPITPLLYALVVAGLLTERDGQFSNSPEANQFLVQAIARSESSPSKYPISSSRK